jgi:hypothetical protein
MPQSRRRQHHSLSLPKRTSAPHRLCPDSGHGYLKTSANSCHVQKRIFHRVPINNDAGTLNHSLSALARLVFVATEVWSGGPPAPQLRFFGGKHLGLCWCVSEDARLLLGNVLHCFFDLRFFVGA